VASAWDQRVNYTDFLKLSYTHIPGTKGLRVALQELWIYFKSSTDTEQQRTFLHCLYSVKNKILYFPFHSFIEFELCVEYDFYKAFLLWLENVTD
jgi:hypothetical protein